MLAYKIILTVIDLVVIMLITLCKKDDSSVVLVSLAMIAIFAMNIGMIWH